jgi:broad specificity phosphatase PhoE
MYFLRHNRLSKPYQDYSKLSLDTLELLATQQIDPSIEEIEWEKYSTHNISFLSYLDKAESIICSESIRTQQTATIMLEKLNKKTKITIDKRLNEIWFSPKKILANVSEEKNILEYIRQNIYLLMQSNPEKVEGIDLFTLRINSLIEEYSGRKVVFFSHGFLIRLVKAQCLSSSNNFKNVLEFATNQAKPIDYLEDYRYMS